jgi:hypothetical protein
MRLHPRALVALAAVAASVGPRAAAAECRGKISGDIEATFTCVVSVAPGGDEGGPVFTITAKDVLDRIPVYKPGSFLLPAPVKPGTYRLDDLGMGMASLAIDGGALYTAAKTSSHRGEVTLELKSVKPARGTAGAFVVHGRYRAKLVPAGGGKTGEVSFDVSF